MKNLNITLLLAFCISFAMAATGQVPASPPERGNSNITYIDIGISQPNVEDCFDTSITPTETGEDFFRIFPNPNPGLFTLELSTQAVGESLNIFVYDVSGKRVYHARKVYDVSPFSKELDLSFLGRGIYFIRVVDKNTASVKQLIIN